MTARTDHTPRSNEPEWNPAAPGATPGTPTPDRLSFRCPACGRAYTLPIKLGKKVLCPCGTRFRVGVEHLIVRKPSPHSSRSELSGTAALSAPSAHFGGPRIEPGDVLGRCRVERLLGSGSSGSVFLARHTVLDISVAVKVLKPAVCRDIEYRKRFLREAQTAAELDHPNIVRVLDCGDKNETLFLVMEYVEGKTVADLLEERGRLPVQEVLTMTRDVGRALVAAGNRGIVHRDVKPRNIIRTTSGSFKLADLGLARHVGNARRSGSVTREARGLGTPYYMPPEQIKDARTVDVRADLYALGATMYHLLAGSPPFSGKNAIEVLRGHLRAPIPSLSAHRAGIPEGLEAVIRHCLAKDPARRYQSAGELLHDVELLLREQPHGHRPLFAGRRESTKAAWRRRTKLEWALAAILLILVLVPFAWRMPLGFKKAGNAAGSISADVSRKNALSREARDLVRQLSEGRASIVNQARIWARLAAVYAGLGRQDQAFQALTEFVRVLRFLPVGRRRPALPLLNADVLTCLTDSTDDPSRVRDRMSLLRGSIRGIFPAQRLLVPGPGIRDLGQVLQLHGVLEPAPDYWARCAYSFQQVDQLDDFRTRRRPPTASAGDADAPPVGSKRVRLPAIHGGALWGDNEHGGRRLLWRVKHDALFSLSATFDLDATQTLDAELVLVGRPAWLYIPLHSPARLRLQRRKKGVDCEFISNGTPLGSKVIRDSDLGDSIQVRVTAALPHATVRVNGAAVFAGELPENPAGQDGWFGFVLKNGSAMRRLVMSQPLEEFVFLRQRSRLFFYPLLQHGDRRYDAASSITFGSLDTLDPMRQPALLPLEMEHYLRKPDGVCVRQRGKNGLPPAFLAWFPVTRDSRGQEADLEICTVNCGTAPGVQPGSGTLDLFNLHATDWVRFRNAGTTPLGGVPQRWMTSFRITLPSNRSYLNIHDEYIVRWQAAVPEATETSLDFLLLIGRWRP